MSIKLRTNLDNYLDDNDLHFDMTNDKKLCIKTKCGKVLVIFHDLCFSKKEPTKDEINFVKKILDKEINNINKNLHKLKELEKNKVEKPKFLEWTKEVLSVKFFDCSAFLDNDFNIVGYKIYFEDKNKIEDIIKELNEQVENVKKYLKWKEEYDKTIYELNQNCNI